jgi:ketosteroid isomerase-like protein
MSEENVEVIRRLYEALGSRHFEEAADEFAPDAAWHNTSSFPGPRVVRGAAGIIEFLRDMFEAYEMGGTAIENVTDAGDIVVAELHGWGHGAGSGIPIDTRWANTFRLHDRKVIRVDNHGSYAKALEAAGLSE